MRALRLVALLGSVLLLPGCIGLFGVQGSGLPKRVEKLEKRIQELEKSRGMHPSPGRVMVMGDGEVILEDVTVEEESVTGSGK